MSTAVDSARDTASGVAASANGHAAIEEFWNSRKELAHIRQHARSLMASPFAVLGVVLVRTILTVPPNVNLPGVIGGPVAPHLFSAIVGPSGGGKGAAHAAAKSAILLPLGIGWPTVPVGSGEGITKSFARADKASDSGLTWETRSVQFSASEVDTLKALLGRSGSTLGGELRQLWFGEAIGFGYADTAKKVILPDLSYRAGLTIGVQPERAAPLLSEEEKHGGTPQRLLFMPTLIDPEEPATPPPWRMPDLHWIGIGTRTDANGLAPPEEIIIPESVREEIRQDYRARNSGDGDRDPLDAHAMLGRLKVAFALAVLNQRKYVNTDDWDLAAVVMRVSDDTRSGIQRTLAQVSKRGRTGKAIAAGEDAVITQDVIDKALVAKAAKAIARRVQTAGQIKHGDLTSGLSHPHRPWVTEAIEKLIEAGQVRRDGAIIRGGSEARGAATYKWIG